MCGIAGILASTADARPRRTELVHMIEAIAHRGPDGCGALLDGAAGLAHARLALVDRESGAQPFGSADMRHWIVFNGEIYNHAALRAELAAHGRRFRTRSDTEVLLEAFRAWGNRAWARLEGQFAVAILDRAEGSVTLARDAFGIAPLFVAETPTAVAFASEAKAILASGRVAARPDAVTLNGAFRLWSPPVGRSAFEGISMLAAGHVRTYDARLRGRESAFATPRLGRGGTLHGAGIRSDRDSGAAGACAMHASRPGSRPDRARTVDRVERALREAVRARLPAEQPVGAYLSGGVDSSLLVALMRAEGIRRPRTLALRFGREGAPDARFDEGEAQQLASESLGTEHRELFVDGELLAGALARTVEHAECPIVRAGPVAMLLLAGAARESGLRAIVTGEGADELFAGYDIFREARVRDAARNGEDARIGRALASLHATTAGSRDAMWTAFFANGDGDGAMDSHAPRWRNGAWTLRFLAPEIRGALDDMGLRALVADALPDDWRGRDPVERAQEVERATFLSTELLAAQGDRVLMANGVEGRYPFLDGAVLREAARLRPEERIGGDLDTPVEKAILREIAARHLPETLARRTKRPYRAPIASALLGPDAPEAMRDLLSPRSIAANPLVDRRAASALATRAFSPDSRLSEREEMAALGIATLESWRRAFLAGAARAPARPRHVPFVVLKPWRGIATPVASDLPVGPLEIHTPTTAHTPSTTTEAA